MVQMQVGKKPTYNAQCFVQTFEIEINWFQQNAYLLAFWVY